MNQGKKIQTLTALGRHLRAFIDGQLPARERQRMEDTLHEATVRNPWFDRRNLMIALEAVAGNLTAPALEAFGSGLKTPASPLTVAVIMAGNIPLVGFHDWLSVVLSGHHLLVRLSSKDRVLLPFLTSLAEEITPGFAAGIRFESELIKGFDAVIATGSDNSARYFEAYFGRYPSVIRKNRNSVAVIHPDDDREVFQETGKDLFYYYGLGCRSVSKIYVPEGFDFQRFLKALEPFAYLADNFKYFNNYEYNKSIFLVNSVPHFDTGFALFREEEALSSPISVVHYSYYRDVETVNRELMLRRPSLQCVVSSNDSINEAVKPGKTQFPSLFDFADGVDIRKFLNGLSSR